MDSDGEDSELSLPSFLSHWREELALTTAQGHKRVSESHESGSDVGAEGGGRNEAVVPPAKRPAATISEVAPLLVLPAPSSQAGSSDSSSASSRGGVVVEGRGRGERGDTSLVETLIADLDEINTVPFFDVQLPLETALLIFRYLDKQDLYNCSLVSRSWNALTRDNLLWYGVCQTMGYDCREPGTAAKDVDWKRVVKEIVLQRRKVLRNWKERICGLSDHQPDSCGVLCAVDYCSNLVLACYTSGAVFLWDLLDDGGPVRVKLIPGPLSSSSAACCALTSHWAATGTASGSLAIIDTQTCSQVHSLSDLGAISSISIDASAGCTTIAVVSSYERPFGGGGGGGGGTSTVTLLVARGNGEWERQILSMPSDCGNSLNPVTKVALLQRESDQGLSVLYSTRTTLTLHPPPPPHQSHTHILASTGGRGSTCVSCFDFNQDTIACGTTAFGYQVQLFDLATGASKCSLRGHGLEVSCVNLKSSPPDLLVSGSADSRVRVFDCRCSQPAMVLRGHSSVVRSVQMDEWKVVSGGCDGCLVVWDQRMAAELWQTHERHPVELCRFSGSHLMVAHLPSDRSPELLIGAGNPFVCHRRQRGLVRVFDFSVDPLYYTRMLPSICSSNYDEPCASFYNLDLLLPYDTIR